LVLQVQVAQGYRRAQASRRFAEKKLRCGLIGYALDKLASRWSAFGQLGGNLAKSLTDCGFVIGE
jgi:hypothetical protein